MNALSLFYNVCLSYYVYLYVQLAAWKLKLCVKKNVKIKKPYILVFSTVDDGWGHGYYLVEALCLTKSAFSLLGMLISWAMFLLNASSNKLPRFESLPNKKYLCWDNETWSELVPDTYKHTEKITGCSHFQEHCNYNFSKGTFLWKQIVLQLYKAKKCALLKVF